CRSPASRSSIWCWGCSCNRGAGGPPALLAGGPPAPRSKGIRLMVKHLRAHLLLVVLTLLLCCVAYPLLLVGAGKLLPERAQGSLVRNKDGQVVGSRLVGQKFTRPEYFWPRPSAADYNASASAGSNWGANNVKLRDRAARLIAPAARYAAGPKKGELAGPDVDARFAAKTDPSKVKPGADDLVTAWAR